MKIKIVFTIIITLVSCLILHSCCYASSLSNIISGADNFVKTGTTTDSPISDTELKNISDGIYNTLLIIGTVIAVIIGAILGIQFMIGSVEQKSKIKEALIPYFAGCAVIFGAFGIWKLAVIIFSKIA